MAISSKLYSEISIEVRRVADVFSGAVAAFLPYPRKAVLGCIRERPQQDSVDQAEDSSVRADAESEGNDGNGGEAGRLAQHAEGESQILPARLHKRFQPAERTTSLVTSRFPPLRRTARSASLRLIPASSFLRRPFPGSRLVLRPAPG